MKTSLAKSQNENEGENTPVADTEALVDVEHDENATSAVQVANSLAVGQVSGPLSQSDIIIPRLNIVQNVGALSKEFDGGSIVLNKDTVLAKADEAIKLTVVSIKKTYEERLPFDPNGPRPETYETIKEVVADGKWVDWRNNQPPPVREVATILVLIEEPEDYTGLGFNYEFEGKHFALAIWTLRNTGYTRAAKKIFSASQIELAEKGLLSGEWELSATREEVNGNMIYVPVLTISGENSPEKVAFITERLA